MIEFVIAIMHFTQQLLFNVLAGIAQQCARNLTISSAESIAHVNTSAPFCFICPGSPLNSFTLNGMILLDSPPYYILEESQSALIISNWSTLIVYPVISNYLTCNSGEMDGTIYINLFNSLSKYFYYCFIMQSMYFICVCPWYVIFTNEQSLEATANI